MEYLEPIPFCGTRNVPGGGLRAAQAQMDGTTSTLRRQTLGGRVQIVCQQRVMSLGMFLLRIGQEGVTQMRMVEHDDIVRPRGGKIRCRIDAEPYVHPIPPGTLPQLLQ